LCELRREKYVPFGGPNGGNGGRRGSVVMEATRDKTSLLDFKFQPNYEKANAASTAWAPTAMAAAVELFL
jgi:GTPase involved in cell partitioning and DNA repair